MKVKVIAKTHNGRIREHNEDSFIVGLNPLESEWILHHAVSEVGPSGIILAVADGMGGENAGEIASEIAVQSIKSYIHNELINGDSSDPTKLLESSLIFAHSKIKEACKENVDYIGMGTTATVCLINNHKLSLSWIGDSRVYRFSPHGRIHDLPYHFNNLEILIEEHSKVWQMVKFGQISMEEARRHPESNIITQSLGDLFSTPHPDSRTYPLYKDDIILICSDGLNSMLSDESIEQIITTNSSNLELIVDKLINAANEAGGNDNITCLLVKVEEGNTYSQKALNLHNDHSFLQTQKITTTTKRLPIFLLSIIIIFTAGAIYYNYEYLNNIILDKKNTTNSENISEIDQGKLKQNQIESDSILNIANQSEKESLCDTSVASKEPLLSIPKKDSSGLMNINIH